MKSLKVSLDYSSSNYVPSGSTGAMPLALPLRVLDAEGGLIAEGVASGLQAADFSVAPDIETVFVRLTWPSGKSQTQRVNFQGGDSAAIVFNDSAIARNEWSAWAVPRLNPLSSLARSEAGPAVKIDRYDRVWLQLWHFLNGKWVRESFTPTAQYRNDAAKQIDFQLTPASWLLQIGGSSLPWRLVSLPGGGSCRVLLTPNDSKDPRADSLKVVVTGFRSDAETLLEFLSRDALRAATSLAGFQPLAVRLVADKMDDPLAAVAGAYFLLRKQGWNSIPSAWFDNLHNNFSWIPDAAIIRCIVTIRAGLRQEGDENLALNLFKECLQRGLPVYAEGLLLLQEAASVLGSANQNWQSEEASRPSEEVFNVIQRLSAANAWAGSALSFYGKAPNEPSPEKIVGMPGRSRTLKRRTSSQSLRNRIFTPDSSGFPTVDTISPSIVETKGTEPDETRVRRARPKQIAQPATTGHFAGKSGLLYLGDIGTS